VQGVCVPVLHGRLREWEASMGRRCITGPCHLMREEKREIMFGMGRHVCAAQWCLLRGGGEVSAACPAQARRQAAVGR